MSIQDIIIAVILGTLCIVFLFFIIAETIRDHKRTMKQWEEFDKDEEDEKWG